MLLGVWLGGWVIGVVGGYGWVNGMAMGLVKGRIWGCKLSLAGRGVWSWMIGGMLFSDSVKTIYVLLPPERLQKLAVHETVPRKLISTVSAL